MLQPAYFTMQQGHGEKLVFWLSTANFVAPFLGAVGTGPKLLITGLSEVATRNARYTNIIFVVF